MSIQSSLQAHKGLVAVTGSLTLGLAAVLSTAGSSPADAAGRKGSNGLHPVAPLSVDTKALLAASDPAEQVAGEAAEAINASLPFDKSPILSARAFRVTEGRERALECLSQAIYYEAGYEPVEGRRAVAQVVLNRVRHPAYPSSVCGVVYEGARQPVCQFSFTCDGSTARRPVGAAWAEARKIAGEALGGYVERSVGTSTHYHADYVAPRWAPLLSKVSRIGTHIFYRWPGGAGLPSAFTQRHGFEPALASLVRLAPPVTALGGEAIAEVAAVRDDPRDVDPTIRRADNDVGGLLDTSTGWRLNISIPGEKVVPAKDAATKADAQALASL